MQKKREYFREYDLVRIVAAIAVVWIHVSSTLVLNAQVGSRSWWLGNLIDSFARWSVPVFIMLSGALLLKPTTGKISFSPAVRRLQKLVKPLVFWSVIYFLFMASVTSKEPLRTDIHTWVFQILAGNPFPGHLYFLFILVGLYLVTPLLNNLLGSLERRQVWRLTIFLLVMTALVHAIEVWILRGGMPVNALTQWLPYVGYYLLGYLLHTRVYTKSKATIRYPGRWAILTVGSGLLIAIFSFLLARAGHLALDSKGLYFYEFLNPLAVVLSVSTYHLLVWFHGCYIKERGKAIIGRLSGATFGVYLVHLLVLMAANELLLPRMHDFHPSPVLQCVLLMILVPVISFLVALGYQLINEKQRSAR